MSEPLQQPNLANKIILGIMDDYTKENSIHLKNLKEIKKVTNSFISDVVKYGIEGTKIENEKENDFKMNIVVKEIPKDQVYVEIYNCQTAFLNEYSAYEKILPTLTKFSARPLPIPKCIFSSGDLIILEDLSDKGFEHLNVFEGFNVEEVKLILSELANFHAASLIMQQKDEKTFKTISNLAQEIISEETAMLLLTQKKSLESLVEVLKNQKSSGYLKKQIKILNELKTTTHIEQLKLLSPKSKYSVLNHGDIWVNNIMYNRKEKQIKFLDFQTVRCTSVAADLSYFLYVNLDPDFRMQYKDEFLQHYLNELHINIGDLSIKENLTIEWLNTEMDDFSLFGLICAVWILPVFYQNPEILEKKGEDFLNFSIEDDNEEFYMVPEQKHRLLRLFSTYLKSKC